MLLALLLSAAMGLAIARMPLVPMGLIITLSSLDEVLYMARQGGASFGYYAATFVTFDFLGQSVYLVSMLFLLQAHDDDL